MGIGKHQVFVNDEGIVVDGPDSRMLGAKLVGTAPVGDAAVSHAAVSHAAAATVAKLSPQACVWVKLVTGWQ
jgi:hypothetical protein